MTKARTYPRRGLHGAVVHEIGVQIVRGELEPGDPLPTEEQLAGDLAVSRTVLREAIKVLAAKRLVESKPKTGTRVLARHDWNLLDPDVLAWQLEAGPDRRFLEDTLELRRLIEPQAARLATERATDQQIAALEEAHREMEAAGENFELFMEPDLRFHSLLLESCDNEVLVHVASIVGAVLRTLFTVTSSGAGQLGKAAQLHAAVVRAIRARDPAAAELAVLELLDDTGVKISRAFS